MIVTATKVRRDEGSVVVFDAVYEDGSWCFVAVDHRAAQHVTDAIEADGECRINIEGWQVIG